MGYKKEGADKPPPFLQIYHHLLVALRAFCFQFTILWEANARVAGFAYRTHPFVLHTCMSNLVQLTSVCYLNIPCYLNISCLALTAVRLSVASRTHLCSPWDDFPHTKTPPLSGFLMCRYIP